MKFYKSGAKWVVGKNMLDAGTCYVVETDNGLNFTMYLMDGNREIARGKYVDLTTSGGVAYTKDQVISLLDEFLCKTATDKYGNTPNHTSRITCAFNRPENTTDYAANDVVSSVAANQKKKETVTLGGDAGTVNLSVPNIANRTVAFTTDLNATAAKFVTDYAADFLPAVVVTASTNTIIFEAATAGVDFADVVSAVTGTMTATIAHTTPNLTISMLGFDADAVTVEGGSCMITSMFIEAPAKFASQDLSVRLYNAIPPSILADNAPFVLDTINAPKRNGKVIVTMDAVVNGASVVSGMATPYLTFQAAVGSKKMYAYILVGGAVVAPESAGRFTVMLNVTQL